VIEGTPEMMWASLKKLRELPGDTRVYCGHEYTLANIRFAQTIEPNNTELMARATEAARQIADGQWTIPTTIDEEKAANPFLRADIPAVAAAVGLAGQPAAEVFAEIRARKNKF
jgi:hydroxyacylglutathione hydrolase